MSLKSIHKPTLPRCVHRFPASGHQCRLLATDSKSGLCAHHLAKKKALDRDADFFNPLMQRSNRFQSAQDINHSLNELYDLLARDRISARRASTLAYISSLLLRTLPAIDHDKSIGICHHEPGECPNEIPNDSQSVEHSQHQPLPSEPPSQPTAPTEETISPGDVFLTELIPGSSKPS